jgi:hypothetical protein
MSTGVLIYFYDLSELIEKFKSINMDKDDIFKLMDSGKLPYESGIVENSSNCFWFYTREVDYYIKFHTDNFLYKHNYPYPETVMGKYTIYTIYGAAKQLNINPHFVHGLLEDGVLKSAYLSKKNRDKFLYNSSLQLVTSASLKRYEKKLSKNSSCKNEEEKWMSYKTIPADDVTDEINDVIKKFELNRYKE